MSLKPLAALKPDIATYREIGRQAIPASFSIMSVAIGFFVITYYLKGYGEATVAAFGVTTRIEQIGLLPTFGLYSASWLWLVRTMEPNSSTAFRNR